MTEANAIACGWEEESNVADQSFTDIGQSGPRSGQGIRDAQTRNPRFCAKHAMCTFGTPLAF
jgi:hypothetical protein